MRYIVGLFKVAVFFTLFAFALNNQELVTVHFFWGVHWQTSMVMVVLSAFALGLIFAVVAMVPRWWKLKRAARYSTQASASTPTTGRGPVDYGR